MEIIPLVIGYGNDSTTRICQLLSYLDLNYAVLLPGKIPWFKYTHIILSGGPGCVYSKKSDQLDPWIISSGVPILGICYGGQLLTKHYGGRVKSLKYPEYGPTRVCEYTTDTKVIKTRWMNRFDGIGSIPSNFELTGVTENDTIASMKSKDGRITIIQYHPEAVRYPDLNYFREWLYKCSK